MWACDCLLHALDRYTSSPTDACLTTIRALGLYNVIVLLVITWLDARQGAYYYAADTDTDTWPACQDSVATRQSTL